PLSDVFATRSVLARLSAARAQRSPPGRERAAFLESLERGLVPEGLVELLPLVPGATVPAWAHLGECPVAVLEPEAVRAEAETFSQRAHEDRERRGGELALDPEEGLVRPQALLDRLEAAPAMNVREIDPEERDRKSTRLNSSHEWISYAVFCLK